MAGTYEQAAIGEPVSTGDPKILAQLKGMNELLNKENKVGWYKPSIIATEQSRENVAFGKLTTPDEVKEVVVPENALVEVGYRARTQSSVSNAGKVALFINSTQAQTLLGTAEEVTSSGEIEKLIVTSPGQNTFLSALNPAGADATTGQYAMLFVPVMLAAGTYTFSVQFKATSGKITAKERKLWVYVRGF